MARPSNDQTRFASEEPFFEEMAVPEESLPDLPLEEADPRKARRKKFMIGAVMGITLSVISIILFIVIQPGNPVIDRISPETRTITKQGALNSYHKRALDLQTELTEADPIKELLPPPPVDLELRLEQSRR